MSEFRPLTAHPVPRLPCLPGGSKQPFLLWGFERAGIEAKLAQVVCKLGWPVGTNHLLGFGAADGVDKLIE
ncbi:MAG: hypothetical protein MK364_23600, partial [Pirellulales bacterium]|nr:hypothetical protein [Pirellulales bacterium]